jgi:ABC-type antimicrobial peptide transport system permease subunit
MAQTPANAAIVLRSAPGAPAVFATIRRALREMSADIEISGMQTMNEIVGASLAARRFSMILLGCFALLALVLAAIGIYGVTAYLVGRKTHEIGLRIALGAQRTDVLGLILRQSVRPAIVGAAIGLAAAAGLTRLMGHLLYGVSATDPLTFCGVAAVLMSVTVAACYVPAVRATGIDPTAALRRE